jgi:DNA mismatch repair protein MutS2
VNAHALQTLEFDRIGELLATRAASQPGQELARSLSPCADREDAAERLAMVGEGLALRLAEPAWPDMLFPAVAQTLVRVRTEGVVLEPLELIDVAVVLRIATRVRGFFRTEEQRGRCPRLAELAHLLIDEREFPRRLERTFEPSGEVRDEASPSLGSLRAQLRRRRQEVSARLAGLGREVKGAGEETYVTLRGGRYVLSLNVGERRRLQGIVHDRSATGKTVFLEPLEVVELNNQLAEMDAEERAEVHRILRELTDWVRDHAAGLEASEQALARLDEVNARTRLALDLQATAPSLEPDARALRIVRGRHALLQLAVGREVVPLDLSLEGAGRALVISGPNMGGKTVVLKTIGLLIVMAMAGLYVPAADGTIVPWVDEIFVDIGDEQSLDSDLSTYGGHLRNMQAILERATGSSLVLLDELGAGTDPDEGAALGITLLREIGRRGSLCVATTHLGAFKAFAAETDGFANAAMEHDRDTLAPTYQLRTGLPGRSHAFELARREGWTPALLEEARALISPDQARTELLLAQVQDQLQHAREEYDRAHHDRERLAEEHAAAERLSQQLKEKMHALRVQKVLEEDRRLRELQRLLREVKGRLEELESARVPAPATEVRRWVHEREREAADLRKTQERPARPEQGPPRARLSQGQLTPGRVAYSRSLGTDVTVQVLEADRGAVWVVHRGMRVRLAPEDLLETDGAHLASIAEREAGAEATRAAVTETVSGELDLRGLDREAGRQRLEAHLDRALLAGVTRIRIIHGKGTGALRDEVRRVLASHPQVESSRDGEGAEGGWGVTIAFLQGHGRLPRAPRDVTHGPGDGEGR